MLKLFVEREEFRVVNDQWGSPTFAEDVADVIIKVIKNNFSAYGIYHFANGGKTNWFEFTSEIFRLAKEKGLVKKDIKIIPVTTSDYPTKAKRPEYSYLSKDKIEKKFGIKIRLWHESLTEFISAKTA